VAATCAAPIKGSAFRMVKVDVCGVPVTGGSSLVVVTKSFVQVQMAPQYEDGVEFFERTADGTLCVNQKDPPTLKRMQLTIDLCSVDPDAVAYMLSARELATSAPVSGLGFALSEGTPLNKFSFEVWQYVAGSGACDAAGVQRYVYNAWPHCGNAKIGNYTVQNGVTQMQLMCETFAASTLWGDGPGTGTSWLPSGAGNLPVGTEHWMWNISTNAPPTAQCGSIALT
jgi:hypothetical protein